MLVPRMSEVPEAVGKDKAARIAWGIACETSPSLVSVKLACDIAQAIRHGVTDEREACAKMADEGAYYGTAPGAEDMAQTLARLIRARSA